MLANHWHEEEIAQQRRYDCMQQAEHERLVRQMTDETSPGVIALRQRLGTWLVTAGQRLQPQPTSLRSAHQS